MKYYFFKTCAETNAQGETWKVAHALPGQTTKQYYGSDPIPVDTTFKVQFVQAQNTKIVRLPLNTVVGVAVTGPRNRSGFLQTYNRGPVQFYRINDEVFFVENADDPGHADFGRASINTAPAEMMNAYYALVGRAVPQSASSQGQAVDITSAVASTTVEAEIPDDDANVLGQIPDELSRVEDHLSHNVDGGEIPILKRLLQVSVIRDGMRKGIMMFAFTKQNGEYRIAYGTRSEAVVRRVSDSPNDGSRHASDGNHFTYFDIQRKAWRQFCTECVSLDTVPQFMGADPALVPAL